ncbi:sensor histidine kinase [Amycolatopsis anabasis]|uniref:sensor histidine kinase n=1 Tax=Amycolatopsis anabasis TaxID=1840409 RepID=UPI00131B8F9E|nr:sensor histidine kinase [Amycolatopsis anabasis]
MDQRRGPRGRRLRGLHLYALDALAAIAWTTVYIGFAYPSAPDGQPSFTGPEWLAYLVAAAVGLPLAVRRRWPIPVLGLVLAGMVAATLLNMTREPFSAVMFALYLVGLDEPFRRSITALAGTLAISGATLLVSFLGEPAPDWGGPQFYWAVVWLYCAAGWATGFIVRTRREQTVRARELFADQALADERLRIARELHDIVAHSMSLIAVKAAVGNHVAAEHPEEARDALRVIESTSRGALTEMRRLLGVLRSEQSTEDAELGPAPGPAALGELAELARIGGAEVDLEVQGIEDIGEGIGLSVYRIVQEALTNVVKHAAPARCRVRVTGDGRQIRIEVTDDGHRPPAHGGPGHGLIGMRERVMLYGGDFTAGPRPEGGFRVTATLPYDEVAE